MVELHVDIFILLHMFFWEMVYEIKPKEQIQMFLGKKKKKLYSSP